MRSDPVEIGHRARRLGRRNRPEFVGDRSGKAVFRATTPAAPAAAPAASRPPFAGGLIGAGLVRLSAGLIFLGFLFVGHFSIGRRRRFMRIGVLVARRFGGE